MRQGSENTAFLENKEKYGGVTTADKAYSQHHIELRRKRKKIQYGKFFGWFIFAFIISAVVFIALFFRIRTVNFIGSEMYTDKELSDGAGFNILSNYLFVTEKGITSNLAESYPILRDVKVEKQFPSSVTITVSESEPVFYLDFDSFTYTVDDKLVVHGMYTSPEEVEKLDLIKISLNSVSKCIVGDNIYLSNDDVKKHFETLYALLVKYELISDVSTIDMSDEFDIEFTLGSRYTVKLGNILESEKKISNVKEFLPEIDDLEFYTIDVSDASVQKIIVSKR